MIVLIVLAIIAYNIYIYFNININKKVYRSSKVPSDFEDFRILQITDFHNKKFFRKEFFIKTVIKERPDVIFLTGDFVDSRKTDLEVARNTIKELVKVCKVYYILGNHEERVPNIEEFLKDCEDLGVEVLRDRNVEYNKKNSTINIVGVDDPSISGVFSLRHALKTLKKDNSLNILLSHRPELFDEYVIAGYDLVFTGHTHGGQIRIPIIGALFVPNQGIFPRYDKGQYTKKNTTMIVSSGIGTSVLPIRIFNKPEMVLMELRPQDN